MERRDLVSGGLVAGLTALMTERGEAAAPPDDGDQAAAAAIGRLRETVEQQFEQVYTARWRGVSRVRQQQRTWLVATRKYPDFIEIGLDVWDNVYDWHVTYQQPLNVVRLGNGHYAMSFMFTMLLLRPDQSPDFVGYAYDVDAQGKPR